MSTHGLSDTYIERRLKQADADGARIDALAAQAARRHCEIARAVRRIGGVRQLLSEGVLTRASIDELLEEIARGLSEANRVRSGDEASRAPRQSIEEMDADGRAEFLAEQEWMTEPYGRKLFGA